MQWPEFDKENFKTLLDKYVQRKDAGELDGVHFRKLFLLWKDVVLPALGPECGQDKREGLCKLLENWSEVFSSDSFCCVAFIH
jgi:hypothetical protein